jgi:hypothetical protein
MISLSVFDTALLGYIDEIAIFERALSQREIKEIYDLGSQGKYIRPIIVTQPKSLGGYWGKSGSLSVEAIGTEPLKYQWLKNGLPIAGATNLTLNFSDLKLADGGSYAAMVWNQYGSAVSQEAAITVKTAGLTIGLVPKLRIDGVVGQRYGIQYVTNLTEPINWITLTNLTLAQPIEVWYDFETDTRAGDHPQRFYRVMPAP